MKIALEVFCVKKRSRMTKFPDPPGRAVTPIYAIRHQSNGLELRILGFVPRYVTLGVEGMRVHQLRAQDDSVFNY